MNVSVIMEPVLASQGGEFLFYGSENNSRWPVLKAL
jgi:hypothetical protein